jgi:hypothetical protein
LPQQEDIFYSALGLPNPFGDKKSTNGMSVEEQLAIVPEGFTYLGSTKPKEMEEVVVEIMKKWVALIDSHIEQFPDKIDKDYLKSQRFITYQEFIKAFEKPNLETGTRTEYTTYKDGTQIPKAKTFKYEKKEIQIGKWKNINRAYFVSTYTKNIKGYYKILSESSIPKTDFFLRELPYIISDSDRGKHTAIIAGTGSGKSELMKVLSYAEFIKDSKRSIIIIDPHGEMAEQIAKNKYFYKNKERLVYIEPYLVGGKYLPHIDPLYNEDMSEKNINRMATAFISIFQSTIDSKLTDNMESLMKYSMQVLLRAKRKMNLIDLKRLMDTSKNPENEDLVELGMNSELWAVKDYFSKDFQDQGLSVTKKGVRNRLSSLFANQILAKIFTGKQTINFEELMNSGKIVVVNLGGIGDSEAETFGALITGIVYFNALKRQDIPKAQRVRTELVLDEFPMFVANNSDTFEAFMSQTRKFNVSLTMAAQYNSQIPRGVINSIKEQAGVKIYGRQGGDEELKKFKPGQFNVTAGTNDTVKINIPPFLLGYKDCMSKKEWKEVMQYQIDTYYKNTENSKNFDKESQNEDRNEKGQYKSSKKSKLENFKAIT